MKTHMYRVLGKQSSSQKIEFAIEVTFTEKN